MDYSDLISCAITTYKRPVNILKRAVESVYNQTYKNIEIIIVNDAPQYYELVKQIATMLSSFSNVTYIIQDKNMGACVARNTAIQHAKGEYIAFLDDDDEWLPTKLEKQYALIKSMKTDFVYCSHYEIRKDREPMLVEESLAREGVNHDDFERLLCENFIGSTSFPLVRLDCLKQLGGFNSELKSSQDYEMWLRFAKKYIICYCAEPLVNYYVSEDSISTNMANKLQGFNYILNEFQNEYLNCPKIYNYKLNYLVFVCLKNKNFKDAFVYFFKAIRVRPICGNNFLVIKKLLQKIKSKVNENGK